MFYRTLVGACREIYPTTASLPYIQFKAPSAARALGSWSSDEIGHGMVRAERPADVTVGQTVTVAVRPERMRLDGTPADTTVGLERGWNALPDVIRELVYTGSDTQYFVELGGSGAVMVRVPNDAPLEGRRPPRHGDQVRVRWEVGSTAILIA